MRPGNPQRLVERSIWHHVHCLGCGNQTAGMVYGEQKRDSRGRFRRPKRYILCRTCKFTLCLGTYDIWPEDLQSGNESESERFNAYLEICGRRIRGAYRQHLIEEGTTKGERP